MTFELTIATPNMVEKLKLTLVLLQNHQNVLSAFGQVEVRQSKGTENYQGSFGDSLAIRSVPQGPLARLHNLGLKLSNKLLKNMQG